MLSKEWAGVGLVCSFDDVLAITLYTIFVNLAIPGGGGGGQKTSVYHYLQGPLNIVIGAAMGPLCALLCSATKLWDTTFKRTCILTTTGTPAAPASLAGM